LADDTALSAQLFGNIEICRDRVIRISVCVARHRSALLSPQWNARWASEASSRALRG
jgi:hypothetical protein